MKKNRIVCAVIALLLAASLAACGGSTSTVTAGHDGATFKFKQIREDNLVEATAEFRFDEGVITADLESGTVDVYIASILPDQKDANMYAELDAIFEQTDLAAGDAVPVSGVRGHVVVRLTGHDATGTVTVSPKK